MTDAISRQAFSDLIGSIYDCALDPSRWERTLADIAEALEYQFLTLHLTDLQHHRFLLNKTVGLEPYQLERVPKYLPEINDILGRARASWPSFDEPYVVTRHLTTAQFETSPYFQEWAKPIGIVDMIAFFLMHTPMHWSGFGGGRHVRQGIITDREIELESYCCRMFAVR